MLGGSVTVAGALRGATVTADNLTAGRVPFATTGGKLIDAAAFTYAAGVLASTTLSGGNVTSGADPGHTHTAYSATSHTHATYLLTSALTMGAWSLDAESDFTAGGSMTIADVTITRAYYAAFGKMVWIFLQANMTTGGTADNDILIDGLPVTAAYANQVLQCMVSDGDTVKTGLAWLSSSTQIDVRKADASNWGLGAGRYIYITGMYQAA